MPNDQLPLDPYLAEHIKKAMEDHKLLGTEGHPWSAQLVTDPENPPKPIFNPAKTAEARLIASLQKELEILRDGINQRDQVTKEVLATDAGQAWAQVQHLTGRIALLESNLSDANKVIQDYSQRVQYLQDQRIELKMALDEKDQTILELNARS